MELLMALAGGVVLAAALFDLLPEAIRRADDLRISPAVPVLAAMLGFLAFAAVARVSRRSERTQEPDPAGLVTALGFVVHSFFDGLAIGLGFQVNSAVGVLIAAAVIGHDFSDGLSTVSVLLAHHQPVRRAWRWLLADATTPVLGALVASLVGVPAQVLPLALGFFSGLFVQAATMKLLPRARALPALQALPVTLGGATAMFLITRLA